MDQSLEDFISQNKFYNSLGICCSTTEKRKIPKSSTFHKTKGGIQRTKPNIQLKKVDGNQPTEILVSNLDYGVSDSDIKELFGEFGALKRVELYHDKNGRSSGSALVGFAKRTDAIKAIKTYNNVNLDNRPMRIRMVVSEINYTLSNNSELPKRRYRRTEEEETSAEKLDAELEEYKRQNVLKENGRRL